LDKLPYIIKKVHDGWLVSVDGRKGHGHFKKRNGCNKLVSILKRGKMPKKSYFREAARRILTEDEFESLIDHRKPPYININKGVVHR